VQELGYNGALDGSAEMNVWLHAQVLTKLADSVGRALPVHMTRAGTCPGVRAPSQNRSPMRILCTRLTAAWR
jgi:hypothetical protein